MLYARCSLTSVAVRIVRKEWREERCESTLGLLGGRSVIKHNGRGGIFAREFYCCLRNGCVLKRGERERKPSRGAQNAYVRIVNRSERARKREIEIA